MRRLKRHLIQALATLLSNPHIPNFFTGAIYRGPAKRVCVPGLNCYSCPGAAGACPIGSLQAVIGGRTRNVSYYVTGLILLFGALFGRLICGFLCPFGFAQDLLHKIPSPKPRLPRRLDRALRWGKYAALAAVLLLPAVLTDAFGIGDPVFCKYVCPAGTLEGGIPLLLANKGLRAAAGFLFSWKMGILVLVLVGSVLLFQAIPKGFFPTEDIGQITVSTEAAPDISFPAMAERQQEAARIVAAHPAVADMTSAVAIGGNSVNTGRMFVVLKPRSERPPAGEVIQQLRRQLSGIPGFAVYMQPVQNLRIGGRSSKSQNQYTIQG